MAKKKSPQWLADVEEHNYPAAQSYLGLIFSDKKTQKLITALRGATVVQFKAKDIFRASRLSILGISNLHVDKDRQKIANGKALSPILLVRDTSNGNVIIADGYHRMCALYGYNEDAWIPCKIV